MDESVSPNLGLARESGGSMAAIEYGSYYWCVLLNGERPASFGDSIHLHADEISVEDGSLIFKSAGRRPAGTDPKQVASNPRSNNGEDQEKKGQGKDEAMIYVAFAPGSWKMVYAAKLQDGSPASVEHWKTARGENGEVEIVWAMPALPVMSPRV